MKMTKISEQYLKEQKRPCTKCGIIKPFLEFTKRPERKIGIYSMCKKCKSKANTYTPSKGLMREKTFIKKHGITRCQKECSDLADKYIRRQLVLYKNRNGFNDSTNIFPPSLIEMTRQELRLNRLLNK